MMMRLPAGVLLSVTLLVAGCATSPPASFYTLTAMSGAGEGGWASSSAPSVVLGPVHFPLFLDRPQIVQRASQNRLAINEFQRWGGTLQDDFLRVWMENLSILLESPRVFVHPNTPRTSMDVGVSADVLAFEGSADGAAVLRVRWVLLDPATRQVWQVEDGRYRRELAEPGDAAALTAALSLLLEDFSRDVAAAVHALASARPSDATS
ncbi:MAG: membrane integrity-associated transporter subunit PqiC [Sphingobacteriia bacterium]|nr:membrane integrity-associated transporter subunit PqiC [Sphingobacteriia bacterium]NCC37902.1 membrane integrity-associated transporter subunit PqiC [Gammaproteobacteria bacterium]